MIALPFTIEQFLGVFAAYNVAVWPAQVIIYLLAVAMIVLSLRPMQGSGRWITIGLVALWAWMGVVYHWRFFTDINPAAWVFGAAFVTQAGAFLAVGFWREQTAFRFVADRHGALGAVLIAYALIVYPVIGTVAGHAYPHGPTLGLPCPTTIATFGFLLWMRPRVPGWLLVIPATWSLIGASAAFQLGMPEDYGLLVAGLVATGAILGRNRRSGGAPLSREQLAAPSV